MRRGCHVPNGAGRSLVEPLPLLREELVEVDGRIHDPEDGVDVGRVERLAQESRAETATLGPGRNDLSGPLVIVSVLKSTFSKIKDYFRQDGETPTSFSSLQALWELLLPRTN